MTPLNLLYGAAFVAITTFAIAARSYRTSMLAGLLIGVSAGLIASALGASPL